jgi:hypothetical protein
MKPRLLVVEDVTSIPNPPAELTARQGFDLQVTGTIADTSSAYDAREPGASGCP